MVRLPPFCQMLPERGRLFVPVAGTSRLSFNCRAALMTLTEPATPALLTDASPLVVSRTSIPAPLLVTLVVTAPAVPPRVRTAAVPLVAPTSTVTLPARATDRLA